MVASSTRAGVTRPSTQDALTDLRSPLPRRRSQLYIYFSIVNLILVLFAFLINSELLLCVTLFDIK